MDIDTLLEKWDKAKKRKSEIEKECDNYKGAVERYMNRKNKNSISGKYYTVNKRQNTRQQISKQCVPVKIWEQYSNSFTYNSYHLKKKK